jgi:hypothetical protein
MSLGARLGSVVLAVAIGAVGCGGSGSDDTPSPEAQEVVEELQSLREGEIVIKGTSTRAYGPYKLKPGGYVLRFEQEAAGGAKLVVALESKPGTRTRPYAVLVDSAERSGTRPVALSGRLYVRVVSAEGEYELRLIPNAS